MALPDFAAILDQVDRVTQSALSDATVTWYPGGGEAACSDVAVFFKSELVDGLERKSATCIEYLTADLPGLRRTEVITVVRAGRSDDYVVGNIERLGPARSLAWLNSRAGGGCS